MTSLIVKKFIGTSTRMEKNIKDLNIVKIVSKSEATWEPISNINYKGNLFD